MTRKRHVDADPRPEHEVRAETLREAAAIAEQRGNVYLASTYRRMAEQALGRS